MEYWMNNASVSWLNAVLAFQQRIEAAMRSRCSPALHHSITTLPQNNYTDSAGSRE